MHRAHRYRIGLGYTLRVGDDVLNVTLIRKEGRHATVLIQDHSIRTSLIGYEGRKKMHSQAVPTQEVCLSDLQPVERPKTKRGLGDWLRSKIHT